MWKLLKHVFPFPDISEKTCQKVTCFLYIYSKPINKMKLFFTTVLFILCRFAAFSQPVLTSATNGAEPGDRKLINYNWHVNQGYYPVQANYTDKKRKVWDFHDMTTLLGQWIDIRYCNNDSTRMNTYEGNCAVHTDDYIVSGTNANDTIMKFPLRYGDRFTSVYENNPPFKYASRAVEVDAEGKLILPNGTYEEVLRVKTTHNYLDSVKPDKFFRERRITYRWYSPVKREYLLIIDSAYISQNYPSNGRPNVMSGFTSMFPLPVANTTPNSVVSLYPNPSAKTVYVRGAGEAMRVVVRDVAGKIIQMHDGHPPSIDFDSPGVYFVSIITEKESFTQKVIITR